VVVENLTLSEKLTIVDSFTRQETHLVFPFKSQIINSYFLLPAELDPQQYFSFLPSSFVKLGDPEKSEEMQCSLFFKHHLLN